MATELWVYDSVNTAHEIKNLWVYLPPIPPASAISTPVREVWAHDGVDFKLVFIPTSPAQDIVTPSATPASSSLYFPLSSHGLKTCSLTVGHSGHFDAEVNVDPIGVQGQSIGHSTGYSHRGDWFYPNQDDVGDGYYITLTNREYYTLEIYTGANGEPLFVDTVTTEEYSGDNELHLSIKAGTATVFFPYVAQQVSLSRGEVLPVGAHPIGSIEEFMDTHIRLDAYFNNQLYFGRAVSFDLNIHNVSDDLIVATWPTRLQYWIYPKPSPGFNNLPYP